MNTNSKLDDSVRGQVTFDFLKSIIQKYRLILVF